MTDFQYELLDILGKTASISVSAPTSAGKSFVMGLDLVRRLQKGGPACIIYLVPTRALIREVTFNMRNRLRQAGMKSVPVRSVPFPIDKDKAPQGVVYVLTQERLMSMLNSADGNPWITTLIVDEAQGIQDDARGIILQNAIETVVKRYPEAEIHFASPSVKNPGYLLSLFGLSKKGVEKTETLSPVSQNLILVSEILKEPTQAKFELLLEHMRLDLGEYELGFRFRDSPYTQRAKFARLITKDYEATILFANRPSDTEKLAKALIEGQTIPTQLDPEIEQFIDFLRHEIHEDYPLIETINYRVAFHYGHMPSIVRAHVEDLFKDGKLQFVCCTSTLLKGINLPARHIIIEKPKCGTGRPMHRRDFLNLAGRAGRLLQEFHGNIWCLRPKEWENQCYQGETLQEISNAMNEVMMDGGKVIQRLLDDEADPKEIDLAEAAFGKLYCDFISLGKSLLESEFKSLTNEEMLNLTERKCKDKKITLPREILDANRAVRPDRLQDLYDYMKMQPDPLALVPLKPGTPDSNQRMEEIIRIVEEKLANKKNESYKLYKWLAMRWIYNTPLKIIIEERIDRLRGRGDRSKPSAIIRELLRVLETDIRFRLVKYYMAYTSILALVLRERGRIEEANSIEPFHVYLECGASDRVALNLIALGLSRVTALAIYNKVTFPDEASPEECLDKLAKLKIEDLNIHPLCKREVRNLLGR